MEIPPDPTLSSVVIEADDRESHSGVVEALREIRGVEVVVKRLVSGDYTVAGKYLVERKTLHDFAVSIIDGRLFRQSSRLARGSLKAVVVIEGTAADLASVSVKREALQGALIFVSLIMGIPVLRSQSPMETANLMAYAGRQVLCAATDGVLRTGYRPRGKERSRQYILQGFPGIGPQRSKRLLERFGSIEAVITASVKELAEVEGLGEKTASKIKWLISEERAGYGLKDPFLFCR